MMSDQLRVGQSPYRASITREPFLFYEMRVTAKLLSQGASDEEALMQIVGENLYQYPTEKTIRKIARACMIRLHSLNDDSLIASIAQQPQDEAKQLCLYALMKQHRLVADFMLTVIGDKYRQQDYTFSRMDLNVFFLRLQEQDDAVASWSDTTITKIKQILMRILVDTEYLDTLKSQRLNPVFLYSALENTIRLNGDEAMLPAFNCFA